MNHLSVLRDSGKITDWSDDEILPGDNWDVEIGKKLRTAEIILFLVSSDFLSSKYIKQIEISNVLERSNKGECRVVPIIVRPCSWKSSSIGSFQAIPEIENKIVPISKWPDPDDAYHTVAIQIERILDKSNRPHVDTAPNLNGWNTNPPPVPEPAPSSTININGDWRDAYNPANGSRITQAGNSFQYESWGILPTGMPFRTQGSGSLTGNNIAIRYQATFQNGWVSQGNAWGTVSPNGAQMTLNCIDSLLGNFMASAVRQ